MRNNSQRVPHLLALLLFVGLLGEGFTAKVTAQQGGDTIGSIRGTRPHVTPKRRPGAAPRPAATRHPRLVRSAPVQVRLATRHTAHPRMRVTSRPSAPDAERAGGASSPGDTERLLIDHPDGFAYHADLTTNGSADFHNSPFSGPIIGAVLTEFNREAGSVFCTRPVNIRRFRTQFVFKLSRANAPPTDGITFTIQGDTPSSLGGRGGSLGYGDDRGGISAPVGIRHSVAVKFDTFDNFGEGNDSTGLFTNGTNPGVPAVDLTPTGIDLRSGDAFSVAMTYDGDTLKVSITDTKTRVLATQSYSVDIPATVGSDQAYVGFTGSTFLTDTVQEIYSWRFMASAHASRLAAGDDFHAPSQLGQVRYANRPGLGWRMMGGRFQGSNDGVNYADLYTIADDPSFVPWNVAPLPVDPAMFRYLRYLSPPGSFGNVAEIEFDTGTGPSAVKITGIPFGSAGSYNNNGNDYTKALDGDLNSYFDGPDNGNGCGYFVGIDRGSQALDAALRRHKQRIMVSELRENAIYPHAVTFGDDFHSTSTLMEKYDVENNGGIVSFSPQGLALHGVGGGFPVLTTKSDPFRTSSLWTASFVFRYTSLGTYGTELRIEADDGSLIAMVHQDTSGMFAEVNDNVLWRMPINYNLHTVSFAHRGNHIAVFVDGKGVGDGATADNGTASRIKIGGGLMGQALGWNDLELRAVVVRQGIHVDATNPEADGH